MGFDFFASPALAVPTVPIDEVREFAATTWGLTGEFTELGSQQDRNFLATDASGERWVVKIVNPVFSDEELAAQDAVAQRIHTLTGMRVGDAVETSTMSSSVGQLRVRKLRFLDGGTLTGSDPLSPETITRMGEIAAQVSNALADFTHPGLDRRLQWDMSSGMQVVEQLASHLPELRRESVLSAAREAWAIIEPFAAELPKQAGHFDLTDDNLVRADGSAGVPDGIIDFGDVATGWAVGELAVTLSCLLHHERGETHAATPTTTRDPHTQDPHVIIPALRAYLQHRPLSEAEAMALWPLVVLRTAVLVASGSQQTTIDADNTYASEGLEREWRMFDVATSIPARMMQALVRTVALDDPTLADPANHAAEVRHLREAHLAEVQEHYYAEPPQIERGWKNYLISTEPRVYLDMVNNVTSIGHGDVGLAEAVAQQLRRLNTNSRFHYEQVAKFADELTATLPEPLDTVFFVNSGSEAVDLAIRVAMAATGRKDIIAVREAYHGWTYASDAVSTSIADNPNALETRPDWVHTVDAPNSYRGTHRDAEAVKYAEEAVADILRVPNPAGFLAESWYGNAGGVELPAGYLEATYAATRKQGGLAIADEVQVGYGRLGEWFWGFESQGVVPDIVAVAKSMGNGYPLGAVVTSKAIADQYRTQGYFFSSTGGSPVSSVVGRYVLQTVTEPAFRESVRSVGSHLKARLESLADRHELVGAVHGSGLYLGAEFVRDRVTREPATEETELICNRLLDEGVIMQPTGDHQNVLKIKPPLTVSLADVDYFVNALDRVLESLKKLGNQA